MSHNQSRAERNDSSQYRKPGRSGSSSGQPRNFSGGSGKGGGTAPPSSSLTTSRSFKKSNNAHGGQSWASGANVNSDSNIASAARTLQNGSQNQPPVHGAADAPVTGVTVKPTADMAPQKSAQAVPKAPSSQPAAVNVDTTAPATPTKDTSRSYPLQFGTISPGFVNGMQIPARTNSAPPNLDEQKRDQARHASSRTIPTFPVPSVPKQQITRKDAGAGDQSNTGGSHQMPKAIRDSPISSAPPVSQTHKASMHPIPGVSMPMPFHQPQVPVQFGVPNPQIQSQGMTATSLPMPFPMGNVPTLQQQVFVQSLQPHPMQPQGIMHQGPNLNFTTSMGPQLPPQSGNMGISNNLQFTQQQVAKFGLTRIPVKITHPDTHEELRLDRRPNMLRDVGSTGPKSRPNVPPSQPVASIRPPHSMNYYNSYNPNSLYFPGSSSVPLTSNQINPSSQAPRISYPISQGPQTVSFLNPSAHNSSFEVPHDVHKAKSSAPSASVPVTVKPAAASHVEKIAESSLGTNPPSVEKCGSPKFLEQPWETSSTLLQRNSDTPLESSSHLPKHGPELMSLSLPVDGKQHNAASPFPVDGAVSKALLSTPPVSLEGSAPVLPHSTEERRRVTVNRSDSIKDPQKKQMKKGLSQPQRQASGQSTSTSGLPSQTLEHANFPKSGTAETMGTITTVSSSPSGCIIKSTSEQVATPSVATPGSLGFIDRLDTDQSLKLETPRTEEQAEIVVNEGPRQVESSSETSSESVSSKFSEVITHTKLNSVLKVTTTSNEVESVETAQKDSEDPNGHCEKDDMKSDNLEISVSSSTVLDATNAKTSLCPNLSPRSNCDNMTSTSEASFGKSDSLGGRESVVTKAVLADEEQAAVSTSQSGSKPASKHEREVTDDVSNILGSLTAADSKDIPVIELSRSKSNMGKGKKKRIKEILQKADAAGTTSDLYMAYKGPEGNKEDIDPSQSMVSASSSDSKQVPVDAHEDNIGESEKSRQNKAEPDDWEDAAEISTPKLHPVDDGNAVTGNKYSRDFLLKFSEQCSDLPEGFEITSDMAEALMVSTVNASRESNPSPGRLTDKSSGGPRLDRRGSGIGDDDKWSKVPGPLPSGRDPRMDGYGGNIRTGQGSNFGVLRNPRALTPAQYVGGILSGPMQSLGSQGGIQRNTPDSDRWQRASGFHKGLIASPQPPVPVMHKAERKYEVGKVTDEEQAKQRQLKAILNKLTPQNFEKLFEQVKAVNIDNAGTLTGVISQIFDKALMEPTFCEMYANFCYHLAGELPDFSEDNEKKITFKILLLNKCQEEFERDAREQEEADRAEQEGEVKQSEEGREEKRIRARRRMLGNIRLIGELYKKKMLTERIMHECIKKLLGQYQNPDEEDIESLCKLMSTIGETIDHPRAKEHMDAYFDMMFKLSNNMKLSSRLRFMLKDAIDLRKNNWQQRRKVEGPKKIDEVHRDAAQERQVQAGRLSRGPGVNTSTRSRQPMDFGPRGSSMFSPPSAQMGSFRGSQLRGFGTQESRLDDRHSFENRTLSVPLPQRHISEDSITLGPQGGLARGMSIRGQPSIANIPLTDAPGLGDSRRITAGLNGYSSVSERTVSGREDLMPRYIPDRFAGSHEQSSIQGRNMNQGNRDTKNADRNSSSLPESPTIRGQGPGFAQNVSSDKVWPEDRLRDMSIAAIKEFYSAKDEKEVALCVKELNSPSFYPTMISIWVNDSFERKDMERDLLANLLIHLSQPRDGTLNQDHLIRGFESVLSTLEDAVNDAPKAGEFLGRFFAKVISEKLLPFSDIGQLIYQGGEEQGSLVEIGLAAEVVGTILETIKSEKGESVVNEIRTSSSLKFEKFRPPDSKKSWRLDKFIH
ncbi:eukaryotic translation initiation factor 4G-like isoform X2 [Rhododendron vialii]|uniref:eukaryotic translation initiation factor 4G-like isoform X2 n=1 Tax=Rhododendron vialii TaxID=182163 RepID=UPI00265FB897|nr:eukaryotic translation initiation factor 4G-like isoform X2 [Rhododendron vialii]